MSGGDKTGPEGKGPMTGGGRGFCTGNDTAGSSNNNGTERRNSGFGGRGRGGGQRGFCNIFRETGKTFWQRFLEKKSNVEDGEEEK